MKNLKFETILDRKKIKDKWHQFLIRKYKNGKRIPMEAKDEDWSEFTREIEQTMKEIVVNKMYPELSTKEKEEIMKQIKIDFELGLGQKQMVKLITTEFAE